MSEDSPPGLDPERLRSYLDEVAPGTLTTTPEVHLLTGGRSNLTYTVSDGTREWVVRRPPLGHVLATAHDMSREYRVLTALHGTAVPVPRTLLLCEDSDVVGAPFFLMERVHGTVYRSPEQTAELDTAHKHSLSMELADILAELHALNPDAVGLSDFGHPNGFLERQVRRWRKQLDASRSRDIAGIDELAESLAARIPTSPTPTIVHGDYRLDNAVVGADTHIKAILDWEMATLGDPLTDLGLLHVYWDGLSELGENPIAKGVGPAYGFPPAAELLERYAQRSGRDLSGLEWYKAFAFFKLAVILEGIHFRYTRNETVGEGFDQVGALVQPLVAQGRALLEEA